jgi:proteasome accessory factor A
MIEDDYLPRSFALESPVQAMRQVSSDLTLRKPLRLLDGTTVTALDMQWELFERAVKYAAERGTSCVGGPVAEQVLTRWEAVLTQLEDDPMQLADQLDWVAKYRLIEGYRERNSLGWGDPRLQAIDLQYHDLRPERCLFRKLGVETLVTEAEIEHATTNPPLDTRAYFRGECLKRWSDQIVAANWDSLVFDIGTDPLRRVPMMEPLRGTAEHVATLFEECTSPTALLDRLGGG